MEYTQVVYLPAHVLLSSIISYPTSHLHSYEPRVFTQFWLQPPLPTLHSSFSGKTKKQKYPSSISNSLHVIRTSTFFACVYHSKSFLIVFLIRIKADSDRARHFHSSRRKTSTVFAHHHPFICAIALEDLEAVCCACTTVRSLDMIVRIKR